MNIMVVLRLREISLNLAAFFYFRDGKELGLVKWVGFDRVMKINGSLRQCRGKASPSSRILGESVWLFYVIMYCHYNIWSL